MLLTGHFLSLSQRLIGKEDERRGVPRPYHCEVPVIQGRGLGEPQALCDGYYGGIDDAERMIDISLDELGHAVDVS
jgi:hypothetical protein